MSSPFKTFQEFSEAEGAIYSFANSPLMIAFFVIASSLVFIYFIYAAFAIKKGQSTAKSPFLLPLLIATGTLSLGSLLYPTPPPTRSTSVSTGNTSG